MTQIRLSRLLGSLVLLVGAAAISGQAAQKPNENIPQIGKSATSDVPSQVDSKTSVAGVIADAQTVAATVQTQSAAVHAVGTVLAIILLITGVMIFRKEMKSLRNLAETVEKSFLELGERVQNVVIVRSQLSAGTRLKALQRLSQQMDPFLCIPPLLDVLKGNAIDIRLRLEAAYGLGRYSENPAFSEYYSEIFSGFREVLKNSKTPPALAYETIRNARRFGTPSGELAHPFDQLSPLFKKWE